MPSPPSSPPSKPSSPVIKCHASRSTSPLKPGAKLYTCTTWRGPESTPAAEVAAEVAEVTLTAGFAGEWLQIGIEGDFNAILKAAGVGRVARAAARSCGFGSGRGFTSTQSVTLSEDHCTLTVQGKVNGWTDSPLTYVMDGSTETTIDLGKTTAEWQGGSILMKITFKSSSQPGSMLRYLRGEEMCVEFRCGDIAATRVFRRLAKE